jgi:hypothetical protein
MNTIAMEDKTPPTKNPSVSVGSDIRTVEETPLEEDPDVLPPTHHEMMNRNKEVPVIDPIDENADDSSVDSDYVPSDQEDEDFEADFVEDIHVLEGEDEVLRKEDSLHRKPPLLHYRHQLIPSNPLNLRLKNHDIQREQIVDGTLQSMDII